MRFFLAAILCTLIFAAGCAQDGSAPAQGNGNATFVLPMQGTPYFASYNVEEGTTMKKEVWRDGERMRADLSVQGVRALSFYFAGGKAYSCSFLSRPPSCYDVTSTLSQSDASKLVPLEKDYSSSARVESVKIGDTVGKCYETAVAGLGMRKVCFAIEGVMAYDSYNVSKNVVHTEYLTNLEFYPQGEGPNETVFALPSEPILAPATRAPPVLGVE